MYECDKCGRPASTNHQIYYGKLVDMKTVAISPVEQLTTDKYQVGGSITISLCSLCIRKIWKNRMMNTLLVGGFFVIVVGVCALYFSAEHGGVLKVLKDGASGVGAVLMGLLGILSTLAAFWTLIVFPSILLKETDEDKEEEAARAHAVETKLESLKEDGFTELWSPSEFDKLTSRQF